MECTTSAAALYQAGTTVCIVSPPDWRIYISPALVIVSIVIAIVAVRTTRSVARQRATLDLIEKRESSEHYRQIASRFSRIRRGGGFAPLNDPRSDDDRADRLVVVDYLNHYELISIGILNDILDERIYRTWMRGPFTRDWNAAAGWIQRERWKREDTGWVYYGVIFANYQKVALRWSPDAVRLDAGWSGPPGDDDAGGPGDEPLPAAHAPGEGPAAA